MEIDRRSVRVMVVTSAAFAGRSHEEIAEAAVAGGATSVQLRAAELPDAELLPIALRVAARCRRAGVALIVNDRPDVARVCGAEGVHVGQDADARAARARIGPGRLLGVSVGDPAEASAAVEAGADYLGVTIWRTQTKPEAVAAGLEGLRSVVDAVTVPVVGIGGISAANAGQVLAAGAAGIAVVSAVAAAPDPLQAVRELLAAADAGPPPAEEARRA